MVRKISSLVICFLLICAIGTTAKAVTYEVYDGNPSNTYIQYFKDIISGIGFDDHYVAFRSTQYDYVLVVGDLEFSNGVFTARDTCSIYTISSTGNYNTNYSYSVEQDKNITIRANDELLYSDLGQYPELIERGAKYEILTTVLLAVALLGLVIGRIFRHC